MSKSNGQKDVGPAGARTTSPSLREAYRRETLLRRFHARFVEEKAHFAGIRGCAAEFEHSGHPVHRLAWDSIRQMDAALADFEGRFAAGRAIDAMSR